MKLTGAQIMMKVLKEEGVDTIFGYPGGQSSTSMMNWKERISGISWSVKRRVRFMLLTVMPVPADGWGYAW